MKNILFATTALVAFAGAASAQGVDVSGVAEMGIKSSEDTDTEFHTDIGVLFTMSGEADNGLTFGAIVGLEEAESGIETDVEDDFTVFLTYGGSTLTMGDTDGAFDAALTEVAIGASIDDANTEHAGYSGNAGFDGVYDGQVARYDYSFDSFTFHASAENFDGESGDDVDAEPVYGLGVSYGTTFGETALSFGLGYQTVSFEVEDADFGLGDEFDAAGNGNIIGTSVAATLASGLELRANYSVAKYEFDAGLTDGAGFTTTADADLEATHVGVGVGYTMNALTLSANWGQYTYDVDAELAGATDDETFTNSGWGLAANYDLGGGLEAQFGYGKSNFDEDLAVDEDAEEDHMVSLGLAMSF